MKQHYVTLNLNEGATLTEIKKASRKLLLKYHPDLHPANQTWAEEKTRIILSAYNVLCKDAGNTQDTTAQSSYQYRPAQPIVESMPFMLFSISNLNFAISVHQVKLITMLQAVKVINITNRKGLYPFITGIIHYQGNIAPLLDLGNKLNLEAINIRQHILICEIENQPLALIIDEGKNVININNNDIYNHAYFNDSEIPQEYIQNVVFNKEEKIHILDLGKLLTH